MTIQNEGGWTHVIWVHYFEMGYLDVGGGIGSKYDIQNWTSLSWRSWNVYSTRANHGILSFILWKLANVLHATHTYPPNYIWNLDDINIQAGLQFGVKVLVN